MDHSLFHPADNPPVRRSGVSQIVILHGNDRMRLPVAAKIALQSGRRHHRHWLARRSRYE